MKRSIRSLCGGWYFTKADIDPALPPLGDMLPVTLPHTWNALDGQDGGNDYDRGRYWYARSLTQPEGQRVFLRFEAVSLAAEVYLNGALLATHGGGFSGFTVELTAALRPGENLLCVAADNRPQDPRYPRSADFTFFGGIYRPVWLITVPQVHFDLIAHGGQGLRVTASPEGEGAAVRVDCFPALASGQPYTYTILDGEGQVAASQSTRDTSCTLTLPKARLWDGLRDPYLYTARVTMVEGDQVETRFGVRSFSVDPDQGFLLNGRPYPLRGVCRHQCRENMGWAIGPEEHREDLDLILEMGANAVRLAHYQHAQTFYDLCDQAGVVVWAEIPFISRFLPGEEARANSLGQMAELVEQNWNHPSIVTWGVGNEITQNGGVGPEMERNIRELHALCRQLDPSRPTTIAQLSILEMESPHNFITDLVAYNHYFGWYNGVAADNAVWLDLFHRRHPERCLGISEYGAEGNVLLHSDLPVNHDYTEEYQCLYHEQLLETIEARPWLWATFLWNMFSFASDGRDEGGVRGQNNKGLVSFDRRVKKDAFYLYKAHWTQGPFVHITGRRYHDRTGETAAVKVYAAGVEAVRLMVNGQLAGELVGGGPVFRFPEVPLRWGTNELTALGLRDGRVLCGDSIPLRRVENPNPAYRLPDTK